jgi:hypothetical protein
MINTKTLEVLFISWSFLFQLILIIHFAMRKWRFELAIRYGWIVYALSVPAALISMILLLNNQSWYLWLGGFIYLIWAGYGYWVEYVRQIEWRSPIGWSIFGPYITLYLATVMFYWWPLARIYKSLWYIYAVLFVASTILNVTSHQSKTQLVSKEEII